MIEAKPELSVTLLILVVDDEPDVELLFRQHFVMICAPGASRWNLPNPATWRSSASPMRRACHSF